MSKKLIKPTFTRALRHFNIGIHEWYTWKDTSKEPDYSNLELYNDEATMPTESAINDKLAELQAEYDAQEYARKREAEYPSIEECVHAILDDDLDALQAKRAEIKTKYPKGE